MVNLTGSRSNRVIMGCLSAREGIPQTAPCQGSGVEANLSLATFPPIYPEQPSSGDAITLVLGNSIDWTPMLRSFLRLKVILTEDAVIRKPHTD
jgi:hypothetical protein